MNPDSFKLLTPFKSYVSKAEVTALDPRFLVKGSQNVLLDYALRVVSRNGYELYGAVKTVSAGIKGSYEWQSSTGHEFAMRSHLGKLEFDRDGAGVWRTLLTDLRTPEHEYAKIWDDTEKIDMLMFVLGEKSTRRWSGGYTTIASRPSPTTIKKQGVITAATTIGFVAGVLNVSLPQVTDSGNGFVTAGFQPGDTLYVVGSPANSKDFTIATVSPGIIELISDDLVTTEAAGATVTVHNGEPTWGAARFRTTGTRSLLYGGIEYSYSGGEGTDTLTGLIAKIGTPVGTFTVTIASPGVFTLASHGLVADDAVQFTTTGALPTGLLPATTYYVIATGLTANNFEVSTSIGGSAVNTSGSQSGVHTATKFSFPSAVAMGDIVFETVDTLANPVDIDASFTQTLLGVELNALILADQKNRNVYGSNVLDYTNFALTSPRVPGDPFKITIDNNVTCIVPMDNPDATQASTMFGAGTGEFFQLSFTLSQDNTNELARIIKLATAESSGPLGQGSIAPIKKSMAYISNEPALDTLARVENSDNDDVPLSDPIKDDFDNYNFTGAHIRYWKRALFIALPAEGILLIYDLMRNLWQPPQTIPISRLAIIGGWLYGHSSIGNETYKLFTGTNDNGAFIPQIARFAYNNGGRRDRLKNMSEYWTDGYITQNGLLNMFQYFGFNGSSGIKGFSVSGQDTTIVDTSSLDGSPEGTEPYGAVPYGGASLGGIAGLLSGAAPLLRFWQEDTMDPIDFTEEFVEYTMNTLDGQFAIVAHGSNMWDAGTSPVSHKK